MTFKVDPLPYAYNALEPHIDARTMEIHHTKHHEAYAAKGNAAVEGTDFAGKTPREILTNVDHLPIDRKSAIINNVGGFCNHNFFWMILSPEGGDAPTGRLAESINDTFGSFEKMKEEFEAAAAGQFGSGWAWLVVKDTELKIISTANQDSPLSLGYNRIIGLDVWEHAYYLKYQNKRPDYISAFWNCVNWDKAEELYVNGGV
ncbi:superoxide dismutase [bacterium]|nr:superoxide dismutase [bacterium]NCQ54863.1 superoxide dismutase [Candidatus Parcubacteria bacterium]NCS66907.1 superoxide dismutase [Candidatus Peregrinibacteria bacterium]NCS95853.1 superoxide dismutase [bacterium]